MNVEIAIIGGTGVGDRLASLGGRPLHVPTPYGILQGHRIEHDGLGIFLIRRHSAGHKVPPHHVNYRAMAAGCAQLGVKSCFATAAVGSLRAEWGPGTFVLCHDSLDLTGRNLTLFDRQVYHRDISHPMSPRLREALSAEAAIIGLELKQRGVYVGLNGPRYETPHEIQLFKEIGDVVGMTAASEAILFREAFVDYTCLSIVTNLAAGIATHELNHEEVVDEMNRAGAVAVNLILAAAHRVAGA